MLTTLAAAASLTSAMLWAAGVAQVWGLVELSP